MATSGTVKRFAQVRQPDEGSHGTSSRRHSILDYDTRLREKMQAKVSQQDNGPAPRTRRRELKTSAIAESRIFYRDAICDLCKKVVSLALLIPIEALDARTRMSADVALARQVAMYLSNTQFGLEFTEVGLHFNRDRTTVSHAVALVEEKRDDFTFDTTLLQLENLLQDAKTALEHADCLGGGDHV